jgi:DNA-binding XRE family transcriptional regulator
MNTMHVTSAAPVGELRVALTFSDGSSGVADLAAVVDSPGFARLRDPAFFASLAVTDGTLEWGEDGEVDIAPEALYALAHGLPLPRTVEDVERNEVAVELATLRKLQGKTQAETASERGVSQSAIANLEARGDHRVATLRAYVESLGGKLEVVAVFGEARYPLRV